MTIDEAKIFIQNAMEQSRNALAELMLIMPKVFAAKRKSLGEYYSNLENCKKEIQACEVAVKALEELQQYRAIGTPEECRAAAKKHGFVNYIPLVFCKNYSPQVLKANMRIVGATEYALVLYRNKLPKFRNGLQIDENGKNIRGTGHMIFNWFTWEKDGKDIPKIHPAQKPVAVLKKLIEIFTDEGDVVIDPCCGSGSTLRAAAELGRSAYGFEIDRNFYERAKNEMLVFEKDNQMDISDFI